MASHIVVLLAPGICALFALPVADEGQAAAGGWGVICKLRSRARVDDTNIATCFPELDDAAREQLVQDNFVACTRGFLESVHAWWRDMSGYCEAAEVHGLEHLREAQARGRGVLLIGGHYSIFDVALPAN